MNKLEKLKKVLTDLMSDETTVKLASLKLADGQEIEFEGDFKKGTSVLMKAESGNIPLKEGEYTTEKGIKFSVNADGEITEMGEESKPEKVEEKLAALEVKLSEQFEAKIKELNEQIATLKEENKTALVKLSEALTDDPNKGGNQNTNEGGNGSFVQFTKNPQLENLTLNLKRK